MVLVRHELRKRSGLFGSPLSFRHELRNEVPDVRIISLHGQRVNRTFGGGIHVVPLTRRFAAPSPVGRGKFDKRPLILNVGWISHPRKVSEIAGGYILWKIRFALRIDFFSSVRIHPDKRFEHTGEATLVLRWRCQLGCERTRPIVD